MRPVFDLPVLGKLKAFGESLKHAAGDSVEDVFSLGLGEVRHTFRDLVLALLELLVREMQEVLKSDLEYLVSLAFRKGLLEVSPSKKGHFLRHIEEGAEPE